MPKISAIIHANNDALRIGRAVESLRFCDEVIVVDHHSTDDSQKVAREHGAVVRVGVPGVEPGTHVVDAHYDWILSLLPNESAHENLEAALHEWKESDPGILSGFCINVRQETDTGWNILGPQLRLVNRTRLNWPDRLPPNVCPEMGTIPGDILRFAKP